jgi:hypothetical protein
MECIMSIGSQADRVIVIDNASDPPIHVPSGLHRNEIIVIRDPEQPPNLSRLWNRGLDFAENVAEVSRSDRWDTAVFGDDVIVPPDWWDRVSGSMRAFGATIGATHQVNEIPNVIFHNEPSNDLWNRMPGWAWMIRGETKIRLDESFRWWWGDTDLDWRARSEGGVVIAPGPIAVNTRPNEFTVMKPELTYQAGQDRDTFMRKWGHIPW